MSSIHHTGGFPFSFIVKEYILIDIDNTDNVFKFKHIEVFTNALFKDLVDI